MKYTVGIVPPRGTRPAPDAAPEAPEPPAPAAFGQAVGFLLSQLGYVVARQFRAVMAEVQLEPRHYALLRAIDAHEGQSQNTLVDLLRIPASSMVSLVDHLEERGLVERRVHATDRRARTLHVTDAGQAVLVRANGMAMALEQRICAGLAPGERELMIERLQRVARNLDVIEGVHPDIALGHHAPNWTEESGIAGGDA